MLRCRRRGKEDHHHHRHRHHHYGDDGADACDGCDGVAAPDDDDDYGNVDADADADVSRLKSLTAYTNALCTPLWCSNRGILGRVCCRPFTLGGPSLR